MRSVGPGPGPGRIGVTLPSRNQEGSLMTGGSFGSAADALSTDSAAIPARSKVFIAIAYRFHNSALLFSTITVFQALVERFAFLDYANSLQDVGYLFGLNNDCLALC